SQLRTVYDKQQVEPATADFLLEQFRGWIDYVALLIPMTFIFGWHSLTLLLLFWAAYRYGGQWGMEVQAPVAFSQWRIDWNFIWVFLAGWLLFNSADAFAPLGLETLSRVAGANFLAISKTIYFVLGFSLLFYYFEVYQVSPPNRVGLSIIATFFYQVPMWLGIADVWLDLRAPKEPQPATRREDDDEDDLF
ncbi:MAG TPA: DUF2232 domain-containing protein, partial [Candidatus Ozemobacteraceae bacterium]|nr:DUF2232 domain-containing protein [Candidatus Ozemobacteraceae bacterium]